MNSNLKDFMKSLFFRSFKRVRFVPRNNFFHLVLSIFSIGMIFGVFIFAGLQFFIQDFPALYSDLLLLYFPSVLKDGTSSDSLVFIVALYSMISSLFK